MIAVTPQKAGGDGAFGGMCAHDVSNVVVFETTPSQLAAARRHIHLNNWLSVRALLSRIGGQTVRFPFLIYILNCTLGVAIYSS